MVEPVAILFLSIRLMLGITLKMELNHAKAIDLLYYRRSQWGRKDDFCHEISSKNRRMFLNAIEENIRARECFAFETTLSGKAYLQKIQQWKNTGWRVELFYLWLPSAAFSAKRVECRVKQGGHDIPEDAIERRYPRSIANLFEYAKFCDRVNCYDNSEQLPELIFSQVGTMVAVANQAKFQQIRDGAGL
jgi:predicted ABC-type ATPase